MFISSATGNSTKASRSKAYAVAELGSSQASSREEHRAAAMVSVLFLVVTAGCSGEAMNRTTGRGHIISAQAPASVWDARMAEPPFASDTERARAYHRPDALTSSICAISGKGADPLKRGTLLLTMGRLQAEKPWW